MRIPVWWRWIRGDCLECGLSKRYHQRKSWGHRYVSPRPLLIGTEGATSTTVIKEENRGRY
jgi:hypothetical protein